MFNFMGMVNDYDERLVANYDKNGIIVDTVMIADSEQPFETGISHKRYNDGKWVIVEMYDSKEDAQIGHDKWVKIMTAGKLPKTLISKGTSRVQLFLKSAFGEQIFEKGIESS